MTMIKIKGLEELSENLVQFCKLVQLGLLPFNSMISNEQLQIVQNTLSNLSIKDCNKVIKI
jgi:hypothetical protein